MIDAGQSSSVSATNTELHGGLHGRFYGGLHGRLYGGLHGRLYGGLHGGQHDAKGIESGNAATCSYPRSWIASVADCM
jgi:hypothetical protein